MERQLKLEAFLEQGMEGVDYCLYDNSKKGYSGLTPLNNGDHLIIPNQFKGYICKVTSNPHNLSWAQKGWKKDEWQKLFWDGLPVIYRKKQKKKVIYTPDFNFII